MPSTYYVTGLARLTERKVRAFRVQLIILIVIYTVSIFTGVYFQSENLQQESLRDQGASYFNLIYHTRAWNSQYGGTWVSKSHGALTNPYLTDLGISANTTTVDGDELTLRNPAAMTREISEFTKEDSGVTFHLTGDEASNPENLPDEWELESLVAFKDGATWSETFDRSGAQDVYRYMQPLAVDDTCTECHTHERYTAGDTEGGVSISIPIADADAQLRRTGFILAGFAILTLIAGIGSSQWAIGRLWQQIRDANSRLERMAITDELTGLANRSAAMHHLRDEYARSRRSGSSLSLIELDIDHFKSINDTLGHAAGDSVLHELGALMSDTVRNYDTLGRIGGEEFLVIAPDTNENDALLLAQRIIDRVRSATFDSPEGIALLVTISAGVSTLRDTDNDCDELLARADGALYRAKDAGRDRVVAAETTE